MDRNGVQVRYVIDFYNGNPTKAPQGGGPAPRVAMFIDARPALDSYGALRDRLDRWWSGTKQELLRWIR